MKTGYTLYPMVLLKSLKYIKGRHIRSKYYATEDGDVYVADTKLGIVKKPDDEIEYLAVKPMKYFVTKLGYLEYVLQNKHSKSIHIQGQRITAMLYIPNPKNLPHVNHIDGDRSNNVKDNLEWTSVSDNNLHAYRVLGKVPWNKGKRYKRKPNGTKLKPRRNK